MNQKGFIKDVVIIVLAILLLGGGYFYFSKKPAYAPAENSNQDQIVDEIAGWNDCSTSFYFYMKYPANWKVWKRGVAEAIPASCNDQNLRIFIFSPDIYQSPSIWQRLSVEILEGNYDSLDDYLDSYPQVKEIGVIKKDLINGAEAIWLKDRILIYHKYNNEVVDIRFDNIEEDILNNILKTFNLVSYRG